MLDLNGHSIAAGAVTLNDGTITGSSGDTLSAASYTLDSGEVGVNLSGDGTLTKATDGTVALSGTNDYTGLTTVDGGGTLELGSGAQAPVLSGGGADIQDGRILFDYTTSSPASTILSGFIASYNGGHWLASGQIYSSTVASGAPNKTALGWVDNGTSTVTVAPTLYGDANLDGVVNGADLNIVLSNYNTYNSWGHGDFNYDGVINGTDLNIVLSNYNEDITGLPPEAILIDRLGASPTNANSVQFVVAFSEGVAGVDTGDFAPVTSGTSGTVESVVGYGVGDYKAVYVVTVDGITGNGILGLNLIDNHTIYNAADPASTLPAASPPGRPTRSGRCIRPMSRPAAWARRRFGGWPAPTPTAM